MSNDDQTSTSNGDQTSVPGPETLTPPPVVDTKPSGTDTPRRAVPLWLMLLVWLMVAAMLIAAYSGWTWLQQQRGQQQQWHQQIQQQQSDLEDARRQLQQLSDRQSQTDEVWQKGLQGLDQRLQQHSNRLRSLATTSREDWLLAEAEYLLRLASQRLLMERGTRGALALLQAADNILVQVDDTDLFPVRDKLARDIAALKLAPQVDRSGTYLQLAALSQQIMQLPQAPRFLETDTEIAPAPTHSPDKGIWQQLSSHFLQAMNSFADQVRYRQHDKPLPPMLPPDGGSYLRQNLRFKLEQAQLALLREEQSVYQHSLQQAAGSLRQFFPLEGQASAIADELELLAQGRIENQLPGISGSLRSLQEYIERLHLLDESAGRPQLSSQSGADGNGGQ